MPESLSATLTGKSLIIIFISKGCIDIIGKSELVSNKNNTYS